MEINLSDWIDLCAELIGVENRIAAGEIALLDTRDIVIKKLIVFFVLFNAISNRLSEILDEEPEYATFVEYVEEARAKNDLGQTGPQGVEPGKNANARDGVPSWYSTKSPVGKIVQTHTAGEKGNLISAKND